MRSIGLAQWLEGSAGFRREYEKLVIHASHSQLGASFEPSNDTQLPIDWDYLLQSAGVLVGSNSPSSREAALRIAQSVMTEQKLTEVHRVRAAFILECLSNQPALHLAKKRGIIPSDLEARLPLAARVDWIRQTLESSIELSDGTEIYADKFQRDVWSTLYENNWISLSAPTSTGKSYIVLQWIVEQCRKSRVNIIYIAPTRALISQVENDVKEALLERGVKNTNVSSIPARRFYKEDLSNIFVFTQERLHLFLDRFPAPPRINIVVIDEAQKIGDRHRGILLQQGLERIVYTSPMVKAVFASPYTENPEILLSDAPASSVSTPLISRSQSVNQNLFWLSPAPRKSTEWEAKLCLDGKIISLGTIKLRNTPNTHIKRVAHLAYEIGRENPGNLVYANGAAEAEDIAELIFDSLGENFDISENDEIDNLIEICEETVHERFLLGKYLKRGVAFHYGNMPQLIRMEIERLFSINLIRYIVCTSTLIEGVNLACRNIFLRGPQKGRGVLMSQADFWNLAGRAGRWGKEFQGNIFCIEAEKPELWEGGSAPREKIALPIRRTADTYLQHPDALRAMLTADLGKLDSDAREREYALSYLTATKIRYKSLNKAPWAERISEPTLSQLSELVETVLESVKLPREVILRNPGISPLSMEKLYRYFCERDKPVVELIPAEPSSDEAKGSFTAIFVRCGKFLDSGKLGRGASALAGTVVKWMRGYPLSRIISERVAYNKTKDNPLPVRTLIRRTMEDIESVARFEAPKYISCYCDVLKFYLDSINRYDLISEILDFSLLLEFGASIQTQISLMSLGLSRTSAIEVSRHISADNLSEAECLDALKERRWEDYGIPVIIRREIESVIDMQRQLSPGNNYTEY